LLPNGNFYFSKLYLKMSTTTAKQKGYTLEETADPLTIAAFEDFLATVYNGIPNKTGALKNLVRRHRKRMNPEKTHTERPIMERTYRRILKQYGFGLEEKIVWKKPKQGN